VVLYHYIVSFYPSLYNGLENQTHIQRYAIETAISRSPLNLIYGGNFAVCIFFILSGYVLTYKYFKYNNAEVLVSGALRRYFRLAFPVLFSMSLAYLLLTFHLFYNQPAALLTKSGWWLSSFWTFPPDFSLMLNDALWKVFYTIEGSSYNAILWTMNYEFIGSMLAFFLASILVAVRNKYYIYIFIALLLLYSKENNYYSAFVLGVMLSDLYNSSSKQSFLLKFNNNYMNSLLLFGGAYLGSYPIGIKDIEGTIYRYLNTDIWDTPAIQYHILGSFFIMLALLNSKKLQDFFSTNLFVFLGKISFSMYLIHLILICSLSSYLFIYFYAFFRYNIAFAFTFALSIPALLALSWLTYKIVDMNSVYLSRYIYIRFLFARQDDLKR